MNLGFKIEIQSNIYKLPGRILTYAQLVDQIQSNFKERVPLKFKISYSSNDDSQSTNLSCESDFKQLLVSAAERNMKNIKLKITESAENENILKDLDESMFNWCDLIDRFDIEDPQLNQQQSLSCLDKSVNNAVAGLFSDAENKEFASQCDLEEKLNQLEMVFSKDGIKNIENNCQKARAHKVEIECKLEEEGEEEENLPSDSKTERIINLDESAIIFIRSENYSPMPLNLEQEQSTELIGGDQQKEKVKVEGSGRKYCNCESAVADIEQNKLSSCSCACSSQQKQQPSQFVKCENQIKFFYKFNERQQLEQTKFPSSSLYSNNQMLNQDSDYFQQAELVQGCNQKVPNIALTQIAPLIPNFSNITVGENDLQHKSSVWLLHSKSENPTCQAQENFFYSQSMQTPTPGFCKQFASQNQSPINQKFNQNRSEQLQIHQNNIHNFSSRVGQEEELSNMTSQTSNDQVIFSHVNSRRKSKTTIQHMPIPSKLTTSICVDNGNQSTVDHSQTSFLNGSNQTNLGTNSILSRKFGRLSTQVPDLSFNQSTYSQDFNNNKIMSQQNTLPLFLQQSSHLQMYCSQRKSQQAPRTYQTNEEMSVLPGNLQSLQSMIMTCQNASSNTSTTSPENFVRGDKCRRLSYKIQCQQGCTYRAKILNSPKKQVVMTAGSPFQWNLSFQNNGESQWPMNIALRCIEGFNEGLCFGIESAQSSSTVQLDLNLVAPTQVGVSKNSFRLCFKMEDDSLKYFGPKVTFELTVNTQMEIDNLMTTCGKNLHPKNLSPQQKLSTKNIQCPLYPQNNSNQSSQNQDEKITQYSSSCSSIPCGNRMSLYFFKLSPSDPSIATIASASSTSISPVKQKCNVEGKQVGDLFNQINCSDFESIPDFNVEQVPQESLDQFYAKQNANLNNNLPFRRPININ